MKCQFVRDQRNIVDESESHIALPLIIIWLVILDILCIHSGYICALIVSTHRKKY